MEACSHRRGTSEHRNSVILSAKGAGFVERLGGLAVAPHGSQVQAEVRERVHDKRGIAGRPCGIRRYLGQSQSLHRSSGKVQRERPHRVSCRRHAGRPRHGPAVHVDGRAEISSRLPAACQPGNSVRGEIGTLQPFGKLQRFGCVLFHGTGIEEEEPCSCQT